MTIVSSLSEETVVSMLGNNIIRVDLQDKEKWDKNLCRLQLWYLTSGVGPQWKPMEYR